MEPYKILYGNNSGLEKKALYRLFGAISEYIGYLMIADAADTAEALPKNCILIGTAESNRHIRRLSEVNDLELPRSAEGYLIRTLPNPDVRDGQVILIIGADPAGVLYGAVDFGAYILPDAAYTGIHPDYFRPILEEVQLPECCVTSAPKLARRGLWTWGHVIYDYRRYLDHMVSMKMNTLIVWDDFIPVNLEEMISYAHENGIRVICGYAWGWDTELFQNGMDLSDPGYLECLEEEIVQKHRRLYRDLPCDGIYFQTFTEVGVEENNGVLIADAAVRLVNRVSARLLAEEPELEIQFGLHAESVRNRLDFIAKTDPRVTIVWENCGAFPYAYLPSNTEDLPGTADMTEKILKLRGKEERFGAVLKGLICLDWNTFRHIEGQYVMGERSERYIRKRFAEKETYWRYAASYWLKHLDLARTTIRQIADGTGGDTTVTALLEDGVLEEAITLPSALMGELLWDAEQDEKTLLQRVSARKDICYC